MLDDLLGRGETQNIEIKGACVFQGNMRPHLTASIGSMANTPNGGTIIVGVENGTWAIQGLTAEQAASFDTTTISHYLKQRLAPLPRVTVERVTHPRGLVVVIQVPEFDEVPIVVVKQIEDSAHKVYASEGDILIRSRTCECRRIASADEMRELVGRAITKRSELLLGQIRAIITGAPPTQSIPPPEELFAAALPDWEPTIAEWRKQRPQSARWEVALLPMPRLAQPIEPERLIELIRASAVRWRGCYYPTLGVRDEQFAYLQTYARLAYEGTSYSEQWQASYTGAFASAQIVHTDLIPQSSDFRHPPAPERLIDFIDICWTLTEFFRFATSLAEGYGCDALWLRIGLHNVEGRVLGAFDQRYSLWRAGASQMPDVVQSCVYASGDLQSGWRELALDWTKRILTVFQWPDADRGVLASHQARLIERRW